MILTCIKCTKSSPLEGVGGWTQGAGKSLSDSHKRVLGVNNRGTSKTGRTSSVFLLLKNHIVSGKKLVEKQ